MRTFSRLTAAFLLFVPLLIIGSCAGENQIPKADFYIMANGDDSNPGTYKKPFATLGRARDAVRKLKNNQPEKDILVLVRGGTYRFEDTVVFSLDDTAGEGRTITYAAYPGEIPVFTPGVPIKGWTKSATIPDGIPDKARGNLWTAKVPEKLGLFFTLYEGEKRLPRARSAGFRPTNGDNTWEYFMSMFSDTENRYTIHFPAGRMKNWSNLKDVEVLLIPTAAWALNILPLESVDEEKLIARTTEPGTYPIGKALFMPDDFLSIWIENVYEALDEPGEWVLDTATRTIYLWPEGETPGERIVAPMLTELLRIEGGIDYDGPVDTPVKNLVFRGITFTHGDRYKWEADRIGRGLQHDWEMFDRPSAMVRLRGAENCAIENCTITNAGSTGIRLDLHCRNNRITGCEISQLGAVGILLNGYGFGTKDVNRGNEISNNNIHHIGQIYRQSAAVFVWQSGENHIANNLIHHTPYTAVIISGRIGLDPNGNAECSKSVRWDEFKNATGGKITDLTWKEREPFMHGRKNIVERNEMHHVMQKLFDGNYLYISGTGGGNVIRYNYLHDTASRTICSSIRCDDDQHETIIHGNIIFRNRGMGNGIAIKGVNTITNNIIANLSPDHDHRGYISLEVGPLDGSVIRRNILYATHRDSKPYLEERFYGTGEIPRLRGCDADENCYFNTADPDWGTRHLKQERQYGIEQHSIAADPKFVDPENGDFTLEPDSPVLKLGFEPIDMSMIGLMR